MCVQSFKNYKLRFMTGMSIIWSFFRLENKNLVHSSDKILTHVFSDISLSLCHNRFKKTLNERVEIGNLNLKLHQTCELSWKN